MNAPSRSAALGSPTTTSLGLRQLFPLLTIVFLDSMGFTIIFPILPFYGLAFGATPSTVGALI
ncbi:MAG: hypothetical protein AAFU79_27400 [Myxococcota bacterium]